jgi:hypothetical protein
VKTTDIEIKKISRFLASFIILKHFPLVPEFSFENRMKCVTWEVKYLLNC